MIRELHHPNTPNLARLTANKDPPVISATLVQLPTHGTKLNVPDNIPGRSTRKNNVDDSSVRPSSSTLKKARSSSPVAAINALQRANRKLITLHNPFKDPEYSL
ncbi:Uncharacterised protein [Mycobacteroides abscessus subsp. massiliense]|nr:Uncharacterised protein [Mycobacteroides abscessus subsp. massiliense]SKL19089.1 Uncharacterised protein [Mycobacteroides abscessus subsp. massiliense]SKL78269.1 Uncharacterised protein [Mycobacteroides abscessus subsp. massiliense]SKM91109.1 Uncharacterised protein [Mycobacteroides abscessus subsp. massiliense]SKO47379.1 Uncharacterised protein [Mycobacteroides abscessus subsp. massiliense]